MYILYTYRHTCTINIRKLFIYTYIYIYIYIYRHIHIIYIYITVGIPLYIYLIKKVCIFATISLACMNPISLGKCTDNTKRGWLALNISRFIFYYSACNTSRLYIAGIIYICLYYIPLLLLSGVTHSLLVDCYWSAGWA